MLWDTSKYLVRLIFDSKQPGMEAIERMRSLAPGIGEREEREKMQPFNCFHSRLFIVNSIILGVRVACSRVLAASGNMSTVIS